MHTAAGRVGPPAATAWQLLRDAADADRSRQHSAHSTAPAAASAGSIGSDGAAHGRDRRLSASPAPPAQGAETAAAGAEGAIGRCAQLQWLGTLGTYAATTLMWLQAHAPAASEAAVVRVHWVGASIGEVEGLCAVEGLLLHALPRCEVCCVLCLPVACRECGVTFAWVLLC